MKHSISGYVGLLAVLIFSPANATSVNVSTAKEFYFHCLEYNAIRADNGRDPVDLIVNSIREKCQVEDMILSGTLEMEMKGTNAFSQDELRVTHKTIIERFYREISNHIESIILQARDTRKASNNAPNP